MTRRKEALQLRSSAAFTLTEVLIVLAIIALLGAILIPTASRTAALARRTVCQSNLSSLATAFQTHRADMKMGTADAFAVADQWPLHLFPYLGKDAYALRCVEDIHPKPYYPEIELVREAYPSWGQPVWDLGLFTTPPIWDEHDLSEYAGENQPGVWRLSEEQFNGIPFSEGHNIVPYLDRYEPGSNPNVYYYVVEDLRTGDPNGPSWATGDRDYEDVIIRVEENPARGTISMDVSFGHTIYSFGLISPTGEEYRNLHGAGVARHFEFFMLGAQSYGMSWHADNIHRGMNVILAMDFDDDVIYAGSQANQTHWEEYKAPRHLGKANVVFATGSVTAMDLDEVSPTDYEARKKYWNPPDFQEEVEPEQD